MGGSDELNRVQYNISRVLEPVLGCPLIDGVVVTANLVMGPNTISHRLGRRPVSWLAGGNTAAVNVFEVSKNDKTLVLNASAAATITLWVF